VCQVPESSSMRLKLRCSLSHGTSSSRATRRSSSSEEAWAGGCRQRAGQCCESTSAWAARARTAARADRQSEFGLSLAAPESLWLDFQKVNQAGVVFQYRLQSGDQVRPTPSSGRFIGRSQFSDRVPHLLGRGVHDKLTSRQQGDVDARTAAGVADLSARLARAFWNFSRS